jgi:hypothetical protein
MPPKIVRQEVHWVPESRVVSVPERPHRVWTLFKEKDAGSRPELPIAPVTRVNAWPEDYVHDWNHYVRNGAGFLRYASRVEDHSVWILCEFAEEV